MKANKAIKIAAIFIAFLILTFGGVAYYITSQADYYQNSVGGDLRLRLRFEHASPQLYMGNEIREVLTLHPSSDSPFSKAGVNDGDIVSGYSITDFYRALSEHSGKSFSFTVASGGDGESLEKRSLRTITVLIPTPDSPSSTPRG